MEWKRGGYILGMGERKNERGGVGRHVGEGREWRSRWIEGEILEKWEGVSIREGREWRRREGEM